jgi:hypothetical protein
VLFRCPANVEHRVEQRAEPRGRVPRGGGRQRETDRPRARGRVRRFACSVRRGHGVLEYGRRQQADGDSAGFGGRGFVGYRPGGGRLAADRGGAGASVGPADVAARPPPDLVLADPPSAPPGRGDRDLARKRRTNRCRHWRTHSGSGWPGPSRASFPAAWRRNCPNSTAGWSIRRRNWPVPARWR